MQFAPGTYTVTATYPGDSTHTPAQATAQMVIGGSADGYSDAYAEANTDTLPR
ncbi:MAG: hypothetical protein ABSE80_10770 [Halobacteriota archaeon]